MKRVSNGLLFFIGWLLSPLTWWNDAFVNMPLSYLIANILFYITHLPFMWLMVGTYWFTNILGIFFMYAGGKYIILSSKRKVRTAMFLIIFVFVYSAVMIYLDKHGKLLPFDTFFERYYRIDPSTAPSPALQCGDKSAA